MSHHRVVSVCQPNPWDVYVGRDTLGLRGQGWGNPFSVHKHGADALRPYLDWLRDTTDGLATITRARHELPGKTLGCWCAPRLCHGDVLARLADGEALEAIRADVLAQLPARQRGLFGG